MTKRLFAFFAVFVFAVTMTVSAADARISMGADVLQTYQALESESGGVSNDEEWGFGTTRANLHVYGDVAADVDAYVEITVNDNPVKTNGDEVDLAEGYLEKGFGPVTAKVGQFEVDFGNYHTYRTDNAAAGNNWFVINSTNIDPQAVQTGLELSGEHANGRFGWAFAMTNGIGQDRGSGVTISAPRGYAYALKFWGNVAPNTSLALSGYQNDQNPGPGDNLFSGFDNQDVREMNTAYTGFGSGLGGGDMTAYQFDVEHDGQMVGVRGWYGMVENNALAGIEADYYGLESRFNATPNGYFAGRYYAYAPDFVFGGNPDATSTQWGLAFGYDLAENVTTKAEYVQADDDLGTELDGFIASVEASF